MYSWLLQIGRSGAAPGAIACLGVRHRLIVAGGPDRWYRDISRKWIQASFTTHESAGRQPGIERTEELTCQLATKEAVGNTLEMSVAFGGVRSPSSYNLAFINTVYL